MVEHELVKVADLPISIQRWRHGADPSAFVFLHGLGTGNGGHAADLAESLVSSAGVGVIAFDLPGFGDTPPAPPELYRTEALVTTVHDIVAECAVADRPTVIGHSWGAYLACHLVARCPSRYRALVLLDGGYYDMPDRDHADHLARATSIDTAYRFADLPAMIAYETSNGRTMSDAMATAYGRGMRQDGDAWVMRQRPELAAMIQVEAARAPVSATYPLLREAGVPILLVLPRSGGAADGPRTALSDEFVEALPHSTIDWVDGSSHFLPKDAGTEIGRRVARWISALP